ncbi:hypothetical protein D9758_017104 [Tetrapyrgos nigripes]|uniref:Domain of unknown function at the cortex 1 domain-containing protein n=1 Tax=Tetrapyrgos nigripes TaxID=182062 RepID=A0A8H5FEI2_9AGAR|nr:hypothetical protein D9758_017104 [Tetrapyrgos nigripes]
MPNLRVLAGTSLDALVPITDYVNTNKPFKLPASDRFEGEVVCNIKGFADGTESEYFEREDRKGVTWSIQVQGRFLKRYSADEILFGNTFDRPLHLPWGSSAALKFMNYIDPTLTHDLGSSTKPWALSPLVSTMPYLAHKHLYLPNGDIDDDLDLCSISPVSPEIDNVVPEFPPPQSLKEDTSQLHLASISATSSNSSPSASSASSSSSSLQSITSSVSSPVSPLEDFKNNFADTLSPNDAIDGGLKQKSAFRKLRIKTSKSKRNEGIHKSSKSSFNFSTSTQRRSYFSNEENRKDIVFGPEDIISTDFCYGFLEFSPSLSLRLPGGISFDLMKYWDGQPVRFVCCERKRTRTSHEGKGEVVEEVEKDDDDVPWGKVFWCVAIEPV